MNLDGVDIAIHITDAHFIFYVNGTPVQVRGTNWVPLDAFHSRDAARLEPAMALYSTGAGLNVHGFRIL